MLARRATSGVPSGWQNLVEMVLTFVDQQVRGPYVLWQQRVHEVLEKPYVVTDSDIVPAEFCPADLVGKLVLGQVERLAHQIRGGLAALACGSALVLAELIAGRAPRPPARWCAASRRPCAP